MLEGKRILITGGTGSIGNYIIQKICMLNVQKVIVFSRDEEKQYRMKQQIVDPKVEYIIGDIRDFYRLNSVFCGIDYVIHTAAMKQVPIAEENPIEAVTTNIIGTENVIRCSIQQQVEQVIFLSSDKSISPTNCMGMTKGICERLIRSSKPNVKTKISCVRLGNVLGSKGSVIPTWKSQISQTQSILLTDMDMTRFIMTLEDVYKLVMHTIRLGRHGEIIFPSMKSCRIYDLAKVMCMYYNLNIDKTIHIIGIREGEKLYEEIFSEEEKNHIYESAGYYHISRSVYPLGLQIPRKSDECKLMTVEQLIEFLTDNDLF
ncbi:MAG: polysaccharide biosynthesis protein [Butyrivibrio sp.]|nr:polysaccharide biosynthesis protein [Butyrivibrio sp.]